MMNPLHNEKPKPKKLSYPVKFVCVVDDLSEEAPLLNDIRDYANSLGAIFTTRLYNSRKYSDDCDRIERLPAFHAYVNGGYNRTFYANTRPFQHVEECIQVCIDRDERKKVRKDKWKKKWQTFLKWIHRISHRKTRMEIYQKEKEKDRKKIETVNRIASLEAREWN
jgi:hypothetical protein